MTTNRLEAFSDGVLAIIITIMVLELKAPHDVTLEALMPELPKFASYLFSFIYIGIYWNNHHHLFQVAQKVSGSILWANLHLLFWLSLIPFTTSWLGENHIADVPVALYGLNLLMSAIAYFILQSVILKFHGADFVLRKAVGKDLKGKLSIVLYIVGLSLSFVNTWIAISMYILVAIMWLIPDRRIEANID
ncbi:MAG: TMEM175 family protein [Altibacter sp.]|uniref:TMEM175 family protein n=1 Tax=Altibacter sp. TaxID=2024823 RepID=UPI001D495DB6|nr:TMEM175 family protein [Altibacter sp.]MBZ0326672.1 TMEM175 family protein [Altibacter sp.]